MIITIVIIIIVIIIVIIIIVIIIMIYIYIKCISTNRIPKRFCVICACVCMLVLLSGRIKAALWSSMGFLQMMTELSPA